MATGADRRATTVTAVVQSYEADGLDVAIAISSAGFARLQVTDPATAITAKVD